MRKVELVPAAMAAYREQLDDNTIHRTVPLPDLLTPVRGDPAAMHQWRAAWIDLWSRRNVRRLLSG